jgi:hypothetical protein
MNLYQLDADFDVSTTDISEQNIAIERIKYFLNDCLEHSIFVSQTETHAIQKYVDADIKVCTLPEEPYDQIIGIMLMVKLNAITEGRLVITDLSISSAMSDGVFYNHSIEETVGPFNESGWWNESNPKMSHSLKPNKSKKVVKLVKSCNNWDDVWLGWEKISLPNDTSNEVVFVSFDNKTDK